MSSFHNCQQPYHAESEALIIDNGRGGRHRLAARCKQREFERKAVCKEGKVLVKAGYQQNSFSVLTGVAKKLVGGVGFRNFKSRRVNAPQRRGFLRIPKPLFDSFAEQT